MWSGEQENIAGNPFVLKSLTFHPSEEILNGCSFGKRLKKSLNIILLLYYWDLLVNWVSPAKPNTTANTLYMSPLMLHVDRGRGENGGGFVAARVRGIEGKWER